MANRGGIRNGRFAAAGGRREADEDHARAELLLELRPELGRAVDLSGFLPKLAIFVKLTSP